MPSLHISCLRSKALFARMRAYQTRFFVSQIALTIPTSSDSCEKFCVNVPSKKLANGMHEITAAIAIQKLKEF